MCVKNLRQPVEKLHCRAYLQSPWAGSHIKGHFRKKSISLAIQKSLRHKLVSSSF